ncbi:hypothetical protein FHG89_02985 [Micromonospora orduensis]|uniref:Uncharacterized protein n=1 Tax=Micromonospora orduensis TaxID=1420891 RepID=A0A5C4QYZ0_9ACTN|nr:hypothetical protein [Micromonospora orduensis]TNH31346.1 hypothetical protein FHG89_02985 [Micromonospora orduensis]
MSVRIEVATNGECLLGEESGAAGASRRFGRRLWNGQCRQTLPLLSIAGEQDERLCLGGERIDLGCGLEHGAFELPEGTTADSGLVIADAEVGLAFFAMRILARLQQMGTVSAMNIDAYTSVLTQRSGEQT